MSNIKFLDEKEIIKDYDLHVKCFFCGKHGCVEGTAIFIHNDLTIYVCNSCLDRRLKGSESTTETANSIPEYIEVSGHKHKIHRLSLKGREEVISYLENRRDEINYWIKKLKID